MLLRPLPRRLSRPLSLLALAAWVAHMAALVSHAYLRPVPVSLAADLARFGSAASWKGVYYKGEKIGFLVGETLARDGGYELHEEGQLQMSLLGAVTAARLRTRAMVDGAFGLRSFSFSLDPGTGAVEVEGAVEGKRLVLTLRTSAGARSEVRELAEPPALSLNLSRQLAAGGLAAGRRFEVPVFDPATMQNATMTLVVEDRELVAAGGRSLPAFRVRTRFSGIEARSWITETGEVVREESPLGLVVVKETRERAVQMGVPAPLQTDMLRAAAVVPSRPLRIDNTEFVERLRVRLSGASLSGPELQGAGQSVEGDVWEVRESSSRAPEPADPDLADYLRPEPLIESDDAEIVEEARRAVKDLALPRARAERLVRHVNGLLDKKPTVSLPSAREVLRTKVGDCNEHTALYVALARAASIPARIAAGLVYIGGGFYYHAWPEVFVEGPPGRGLWLPVDPTLNQFPADATHIRLARGGLDRQAALLPLIGALKMEVLELRMQKGYDPVLLGREQPETAPPAFAPPALALPRRDGSGPGCWSRP
jgi:hypothetical protein